MNLGFSYSYNGRGELTGLVNPYGETYSWTYYGNGWLHTQQSANAATTTYSYNLDSGEHSGIGLTNHICGTLCAYTGDIEQMIAFGRELVVRRKSFS